MGLLNKFREDVDKKTLEQEIYEHLTVLLNIKESFGAYQKGLGLKNYCYNKSDHTGLQKILADIMYNIQHYEKRIKLLELKAIDNSSPSNIKIQVDCKIKDQFRSFFICFNQYQQFFNIEI